jgi:hypothetical protein
MKRNKKGQFVYTTGKGRYKRTQVNGKNLQEHRLIWELHYGKIPDGMIVHHIDGNKMNNNIDNLKAMTFTEHNNIHTHIPWNKGVTSKNNKKWNIALKKSIKTRKKNYLYKLKETFIMRDMGYSAKEISRIMGICERQVHSRLKEYKDRVNYKVH